MLNLAETKLGHGHDTPLERESSAAKVTSLHNVGLSTRQEDRQLHYLVKHYLLVLLYV